MGTLNNSLKESTRMHNESNWRQHGADVFWGEIAPCEHSVQIYDNDDGFLDCLEGFVVGGLKTGDVVIIIATEPHRKSLENRLRARGVNLAANGKDGQFFSLDAEEALTRFMVDDMPDEVLFDQFVNSILAHSAQEIPSAHSRVRRDGGCVVGKGPKRRHRQARTPLAPVLSDSGFASILRLSQSRFHPGRRCVDSGDLRDPL
jgi:hypothetical protein